MSVLRDKVVIVTGAGRGIGRGIALAAAEAGAHVVVADLGVTMHGDSPDGSVAAQVVAEIARQGGSAAPATGSVATRAGAEEIVEAALSNWGRLDGVVCCAGIVRHKPFFQVTERDFEDVLGVHLIGHFLMFQTALKAMIRGGNPGSLVGISSGYVFGDPNRVAYRCAKAGVVALTKSVAHVAAEHGCRANALAPIAATRLTEAAGLNFESEPADIGPAAVYLLSDRSRDINGDVFSVHGHAISRWEDAYEGHTARHHSRWGQADIDGVMRQLRSGAKPLPPYPPLPPRPSGED